MPSLSPSWTTLAKEKGKTFKPVTCAGSAKKTSTPQPKRNKNSMFGGLGDAMPSVPEEVSFTSPYKNDDASTICTKEQDHRFSKKGGSTKGSTQGDPMEVDGDDDSSWDSDCVASDSDEEKDEDSEKKRMAEQLKTQQEQLKKQQEQMAEMMKQQQEFMKMMTGETGLNKSKSNDSEESGNSSPKKKKGSKGLAESSSSVSSNCTRQTRGSAARDEKRKQNEKKKRSKQW